MVITFFKMNLTKCPVSNIATMSQHNAKINRNKIYQEVNSVRTLPQKPENNLIACKVFLKVFLNRNALQPNRL